MNQTKKIFVAFVSFWVLMYLLIKGFIYYQTTNQLNELIKQTTFVDVHYEGISSDLLTGSIQIEAIEISLRSMEDLVQIRKIMVQGEGPLFLFKGMSFVGGKIPETLALTVDGLRVGLGGEIFNGIMNVGKKRNSVDPAKTCLFGHSLNSADFRALGYDELYMNASVFIKENKKSQQIQIDVSAEIEEVADFGLEASFKKDGLYKIMSYLSAGDELRLSYQIDRNYMRNLRKYCASVLKITEDEYIDSIARASQKEYLKYYGFSPGQSLRKVIKRLLHDSDEIEVHIHPEYDLYWAELQQVGPDDRLTMLGLYFYIDEQPVKDLSFILGREYKKRTKHQSIKHQKGDFKKKDEKVKVVYAFQKTVVEKLPQYIGARVKLFMADGRQREGTLIAHKGNVIQIEQRVHSGKFSVYVSLDKIKTLQVHRLVRVKVH